MDGSTFIDCEITDDDLAAYASALKRAPVGRRGYAALAVLYEVLLFFAVAAFMRSWTIAVLVLPVGLLVGYFVLPPLLRSRVQGRFGRRRSAARMPYRARVHLHDVGITQHTEYGSSSRRWFAVEDVLHDERGLYVRTSPMTVVVIPRRAVPSEDQWRSTVAYVQHCFRSAVRPVGL